METLVLTGLTTVGGILVLPLVIEFLKQHLAVIVSGIAALVFIASLVPHSPEAAALWKPISMLPHTFMQALSESDTGMVRLSTAYFSAFHQ